eukprot:7423650-Pyramimonas_sp.AAC.1
MWEALAARMRELAVLKARQKQPQDVQGVANIIASLSERLGLLEHAKGGDKDAVTDRREDTRVLHNVTCFLAGQACPSLRSYSTTRPTT